MTEWIDFRITQPETDVDALVFNENGYMDVERATYDKRYGIWNYYNPSFRPSLLLDVTHYFVIPPRPALIYKERYDAHAPASDNAPDSVDNDS